jgi:hypothetical protein
LFNIFIDDVIDIHMRQLWAGLLFADDLAIGSVTVTGVQKGADNLTKYCKDWSLKCNLKRTKILVCKKRGKLKKS